MSREKVSTEFDCRRIHVIVHQSAQGGNLLVILFYIIDVVKPAYKNLDFKNHILWQRWISIDRMCSSLFVVT